MNEASFAARVAAAMYERDRAAHAVGIALDEVRFGYARCSFEVKPDMINGHDVCHGGYVFMLADTAFAYACNSRNDTNVALACSISYVAASRAGQRLVAEAVESARTKRTGTYDISVRGPEGETIALFRGTSFNLGTSVIRE